MNLVGQVLADRYEIVEEIGVGGMAVVYKAKCRVLNRYVAIKVLREDLKNDVDFVKRFNIEAQAAASLTHPNIVSVFDVGTDKGYHYIVMEYVEGETLKEYIEQKHKLPWREAVDIAMQICKGLEVAHKNSIVHRDIKPHNIMRTPDGVIKVMDFGIARASLQETMTADDSAIGSVHYISPEQARGGFVDHRSDIYSLGIVLYEMLTGKVPFDNDSPVTIAIKHIQEKPVPPCEYNISIPIPLEQVVLKAIEKDPAKRFKDAAEFYTALSDILNDPQRKLNADESTNYNTQNDETRVYKTVDIPDDSTVVIQSVNNKQTLTDGEEMKKNNRKSKKKYIDKNKEKKVVILAIVSSIVVIFGLLFAFASLTGLTDMLFPSGDNVEIPDLKGMTFEEAVETYSESGFTIVVGKEVESEEKAGEILSQDPKSGTKIKQSDEMIIKVDISKGNSEIILDNYVKYTDRRNVELEMKNLGLECEFIDEASDEIPEGAIIRQVPSAGSSVEEGDTITFFVSTGPLESEEEPQDENNDENNNQTGNENNNTGSGNEGTNSNTGGNTNSGSSGNTNTGTQTPEPDKKSSMLTVYGPKDKDSANVQVKVNGSIVYSKNIKKGESEVVKIEGTANTVEVEILYDGVSAQKSTVTLH